MQTAESETHPMAREMLLRFGPRFDEETRGLLENFVEHDEAAVAFEEVAGILAHGDQSISEDDLQFLRELGQRWETPRDPIPWSLLEAKVGRLPA